MHMCYEQDYKDLEDYRELEGTERDSSYLAPMCDLAMLREIRISKFYVYSLNINI